MTRGGLARRAVVGVAAVALLGVGAWTVSGPDETSEAVDLRPPAPVEQQDARVVRGPRLAPRRPAPLTGDAMRLEVPSVGIDAAVDPVPVVDSVLEPPDDVDRVGWWDESVRPGSRDGQSVMTGHSVSTGGGAMTSLVDVEPGAAASVLTSDGRTRYEVARVLVLGRDELASEAQAIFGQHRRDGRLVLVTCANWNGSVWEDNLVVYAQRLDASYRGR